MERLIESGGDTVGARPVTLRYKNDDIRNDVGASFFIRIQTYKEQTSTLTVNISWAP